MFSTGCPMAPNLADLGSCSSQLILLVHSFTHTFIRSFSPLGGPVAASKGREVKGPPVEREREEGAFLGMTRRRDGRVPGLGKGLVVREGFLEAPLGREPRAGAAGPGEEPMSRWISHGESRLSPATATLKAEQSLDFG